MTSKPFKFVVGPNRMEFFVHTEALIAISPVLRVMITGSMREAVEGVAVLENIDVEDFTGLCEYAYSGSYESPIPDSAPPELPFRPDGNASNAYGVNSQPRAINFLHGTIKDAPAQQWMKKYRDPPVMSVYGHYDCYRYHDKDWTENLLYHANIYILADTYDVSGLRSLARHCIYKVLRIFEDTWDSIPAIEKLIRLIYENTQKSDELRGLLSSYVAIKSENFFLHPHMQKLRDDCPEFCSDVLQSTIECFACELREVEEKLKRKNEELETTNADKRAKLELEISSDDSS
ncbi:hypothetical protein F4805DRAFT_460470 [Annulohypoxylon moriforme]|nr:hypothetical protein F4805DRAFT_460470 [Annulohypoxylon moriforme]